MANIGTFTREDNAFTGTISTLALKAKTIIKPVATTSDNAPDYRIYAAGVEIGAAWEAMSKTERPYLSVKRNRHVSQCVKFVIELVSRAKLN